MESRPTQSVAFFRSYHLSQYGDFIDISGYRFTEMYIVGEESSVERLPFDGSGYGLVPWEFVRKFGILHYHNYCSGNYTNRLGEMPLGSRA